MLIDSITVLKMQGPRRQHLKFNSKRHETHGKEGEVRDTDFDSAVAPEILRKGPQSVSAHSLAVYSAAVPVLALELASPASFAHFSACL